MSMEQAILEHAAALRELAGAMRYSADRNNGTGQVLAAHLEAERKGENVDPGDAIVQDKAAELAAAKAERAEAARKAKAEDEKANAAKAQAEKDAELAAAVQKVEDEAKGAEPLDYHKDVKPALLAAIKAGKRGEVEAYLKKAGVDKADKLPVEALPAALQFAQELVA